MKKFSDWMEDKGYDFIGYTAENTHIKPTPQMLVGYQLEWLSERFNVMTWVSDDAQGKREYKVELWGRGGSFKNEFVIFAKTLPEALNKAIEYVEGQK
jgi:hypothetical protein